MVGAKADDGSTRGGEFYGPLVLPGSHIGPVRSAQLVEGAAELAQVIEQVDLLSNPVLKLT